MHAIAWNLEVLLTEVEKDEQRENEDNDDENEEEATVERARSGGRPQTCAVDDGCAVASAAVDTGRRAECDGICFVRVVECEPSKCACCSMQR